MAVIGIGLGATVGGSEEDGDTPSAALAGATDADGRGSNEDRASTTVPQSSTTRERTTTTSRPTTTTTVPEAGTRENPFPPGTPLVTSDGVEVSVASVNMDGNSAVANENQFNDPPPEGHRYVLVNLSVTNGGDEPITPWIEIDVNAIGSANTVHETCGVVAPDSLSNAPELYPGGSATGNVCLVVPSAEIDDGSLLIMLATLFGDPVFVRP